MSTSLKLGLLGNGIGRSRVGLLHEMIGRLCGLDVSYQLMDLSDRKSVIIEDELRRCRDEGFRGVNVTHPYKLEAYDCVTTSPDFPRGLSAVNTVLFEGDAMQADNTDFSGFCIAFRNHFGADFKPGKVLMLGAGGVSRAIAFGLQTLGTTELIVYDTQPRNADGLLSSLRDTEMPARLAGADLVVEMRHADGLVNATPVGMYQYPGSPFPEQGYARQRWGFDSVYTPENTEFMQRCNAHGIETLSGFKLFLYQGIDAFSRFSGRTVSAKQVESTFLQDYPLE